MTVRLEVSLSGFDRFAAKMDAGPTALRDAIFEATTKATDATANAIRTSTPVRTGKLVGSITARVSRTPDGAKGRISSSVRYARFVESGTREHGRAQLMFQRGIRAEEPNIAEFYRSAVDRVVVSLN